MKIFWVVAWSNYYPAGGLGNVHSQWATREEAEAAVAEINRDPYSHKCHDHVRVMDVSDMLGMGDVNEL